MFSRNTSLSIAAFLAVACLLAFAPAGWTQDTVKEHNITGCLHSGSAPNSYMISSGGEDAPIKAAIVSSNADLATHLGQKVEITGTLVPAQEAEADPKAPKAFHYMKVTTVKTISATCP